MPAIRVAMCATIADFHACEDVQITVWGGSEREIVPYDILRAIAHAGGTVPGAWDGDRLVGMAVSFVAWGVKGAYHHSHLLAVLPEYRRCGIGRRLKMMQRDAVLAQGLDRITWTFDPLESANAHLNLAKLGGISRTYLPDYYGAMPEALNAALPSDRLLVEWNIRSPHVLGRLATTAPGVSGIPLVSPGALDAPYLLRLAPNGAPQTLPAASEQGIRPSRIEIPTDIQALKAADPARALAWRLATRAAFTDALARGLTVTDYRAPQFHRPGCGCYLLSVTDEEAADGGESIGVKAIVSESFDEERE